MDKASNINQRSIESKQNNVLLVDEAETPVEQPKEKQPEPRQLKLQGVMKPEVASALNLKTHFKAFDYREQQMMIERQKELERLEAESKTQVGAVKRLLVRVSSLSVGAEPIKRRAKTSRNLALRRSLSQKGIHQALEDY